MFHILLESFLLGFDDYLVIYRVPEVLAGLQMI
jgi:hypothetical protein